ncbi:barstar family protein [Paenibacillus yanchengensis]|uniref:Barstar family protein n=1 Tax=Paenibacillus yanchengensis TaxID=2035833 RepID=A0ABW4YNH4_9BACL
MNTIALYETDLTNYMTIQQWLKQSLQFPEWYGENLDALYDMLTGWLPLPLTIVWYATENPQLNNDSSTDLQHQLLLCREVFAEAATDTDSLLIFEYRP